MLAVMRQPLQSSSRDQGHLLVQSLKCITPADAKVDTDLQA